MKRRHTHRAGRRQFLVASSLSAGGLALGFHLPALAQASSAAEVNAWVLIEPDDSCVIRVARAEMGQGTHTGLAMLVAEELGCDWKNVRVQQVTPGQNLAAKRVWRNMSTGGSRGIRESHEYVRQGGAAARMMLVQAAADEWKVPVAELTVDKGVVLHAASQRKLRYGQLAAAASKLTPPDPKTITLKNPRNWTIAGKPTQRLDTAAKVNGQTRYGIDTALPGMLYAAIKDCPVFGGKLVSFDAAKVSSKRGIKGVVRVDASTVAVVADSWWRAKMALEELPIVWDEGANAKESSAAIAQRLKAGLTASNGVFADTDIGNVSQALAGAAKRVEAVYSTPFVPCLHGADELHGPGQRQQGRGLGVEPERRSLAGRAGCRDRPAAGAVRGLQPAAGWWLRPPGWPAVLRAPGRSRGQAVPGLAGEVDLEP